MQARTVGGGEERGGLISGLIMPAMTFIGNLVYVGIAVKGGLQVASGAMQLGSNGQPAAVWGGIGGVGVFAVG